MNEEKIAAAVEEALNPEEFDLLDYLDGQPVAEDSVEIYTHVPSSKRLHKLLDERSEVLATRRAAEQRGESVALGLDESDEDTEYDDEINALVDKLEKTKLTFNLKTLAPALEKAIRTKYVASADPNATKEERTEHEETMFADILARSIDYVVRGDGAEDHSEWNAERLKATQKRLYEAQAGKLLAALSEMVYVGNIFEDALTADFS